MKTRLFNNLSLKIVSLVVAFFVWLIVVNVNDPVIVQTISSVPVSVTNMSYVESLGMSGKLSSGTVSVMVEGNRSVVESLTRDDVKAEADLTQIVRFDAEPIMVPVSVSISGISAEDITVTPGNIEIILEEILSQDFLINVTTGDTKPASKNYIVGETTVAPEKVTITGPKSLIEIIGNVNAPIDVSGLYTDTTLSTNLVIYDKNGAQFTETQMSSLKFSRTDGTVSVHVDLWRILSDAPLSVTPDGAVASGYQIGDVTITPSVITVAGTDEALEALSKVDNKITIPPEFVDVTDATGEVTVRIDDINAVLGSGLKLADSTSSTVLITVEVLPLNSKSIDYPTVQIEQRGMSEGLAVSFLIDKIRVQVQGSDENLERITASDIKASVDLTGKEGGNYYADVPVNITLPDGYLLLTPVTVDVQMVVIQDSSAESGESAP